MITYDFDHIKALVKEMGLACLHGEEDAMAGHGMFTFPKMYADKNQQDAYLIGMRRQQEIMRGAA